MTGPGSSPNNGLLVLPQVNKSPRSACRARPAHPAPLALCRWYCPVSSCPDHCQESSRGWTSFKGLRFHLDLHFMANCPARYPSIGSISMVMVSAAYAIVSCRFTSMGCTPDAIVPPQQRRFRPLPLSVDPLSTGHLVYLMSPPPTVDSAFRSPRVPKTCGASASSMHLRRWLLIVMNALGSTSSPCLP